MSFFAYQICTLAAWRLSRWPCDSRKTFSRDWMISCAAVSMRAALPPFEPASKPSRKIEQRRAVDRSIVEGYRRTPPTFPEETAALESLRQAIVEEPW